MGLRQLMIEEQGRGENCWSLLQWPGVDEVSCTKWGGWPQENGDVIRHGRREERISYVGPAREVSANSGESLCKFSPDCLCSKAETEGSGEALLEV